MAKGRIIVSAITCDKCVNNLSDDTSRLAFTWLLTFADSQGRTYGDPAVVRSMLFPRREDVSIAQMEQYITEWAACRLIVWYEADGDLWIAFPSFFKHQTGFDKRHEPASIVPVPPERQCTERTPDIAGTLYVHCTSEVKRSEEKLLRRANANDDDKTAEPSAIAPVVVTEKRRRKPPDRTREETQLMGVFCEVTGLHLPHLQKDINWWFSELRGIQGYVEGDHERAVKLVRETVHDMQRRKEPLTITSPKSIIGIANSLAATNGRGVQL